MTVSFRDAVRSSAKPLIGLYAESGKGKTWSALMLARGFVGPKGRIAMIETESGRGEAYADLLPGGYKVLSLHDDFAPARYREAIKAAEAEKFDALIIDSASHEWEGSGGVLSMASDNQAAGKKGPIVWQKPKIEHQQKFMLPIMQTSIPLVIVCMRAKYPMKEVPKPGGGKEWVRLDVLEPKQADDILYEMFIHGWIDDAHRFHGTKYTRDDLRQVIRDNEPISIETGERLAAWAAGRASPGGAEPAREVGGGGDPGDNQPVAAPAVDVAALKRRASYHAGLGIADLEAWWKTLTGAEQRALKADLAGYKAIAEEVDQRTTA